MDKYDTDFLCTYMFYDVDLAEINPLSKKYIIYKKEKALLKLNKLEANLGSDSDSDSDSDFESESNNKEYSDYLYKNELLHAFNLNDYNDTTINVKISELYKLLCIENPTNNQTIKLKNIINKLSEKYFNNDIEAGFIMLFSYQLFHITHNILCNILCNIINDKSYDDKCYDDNINSLVFLSENLSI